MSFVLTLSAVLSSVHLYLWKRLVRDARLPRTGFWFATLALVVLCASVPLTLWYAHRASGATSYLAWASYTWLGAVFYLLTILFAFDVLRAPLRAVAFLRRRFLGSRVDQESVIDALAPPQGGLSDASASALALETRRTFVARSVATTALVATGGIAAVGIRNVWDITTPEVQVRLARLPAQLEGYTIALLSDIHIGPTLDGRFLRHLVEQTSRIKPDVVVITGDLVDGAVRDLGDHVAELRKLRARDGVVFVTGNHEYYSGVTEWVAFLRTLGIRVLMNEHMALGDRAPGGARFDLGGVPDHHAARFGSVLAPDALAAVAGRDVERELVMLAHQPAQIHDVLRAQAGLQLSGHTHGGQMAPFDALTALAQPYLAGLHTHGASGTQIYVSRGSGFWGPPMRIRAPAEITALRLISG